jgi:hypothetical protein
MTKAERLEGDGRGLVEECQSRKEEGKHLEATTCSSADGERRKNAPDRTASENVD